MSGDRTSGDQTSGDEHAESTASSDGSSGGGANSGSSGAGDSGPSSRGSGETTRILSPTLKSSLLWGAVGGLAFLVLIQGYELLVAQAVSVGAKVGVGLAVAVVAATTTHVTRGRFPSENESS